MTTHWAGTPAKPRPLPNDPHAEAACLGSLMWPTAPIDEVFDIVRDRSDFYLPKHGAIFQAIVDVHDRGEVVDPIKVKTQLADCDVLEEIGGVESLTELIESMPHGLGAPSFAKTVRSKARLRRLVDCGQKILELALTPTDDAGVVIEEVEALLLAAIRDDSSRDLIELSTTASEVVTQLSDGTTDVARVKTGFFDIDELTGGFRPGNLVIVAARPSHGKTVFALNAALQVVSNESVPVGFFSLEQTNTELASRALAIQSGVRGDLIFQFPRNLDDDHHRNLRSAADYFSEAPSIILDDTSTLSLMRLRARARRMVAQYKAQVIVLDYLQIMAMPDPRDTVGSLTQLSGGLKALARELDVPIVCLSQLSRAVEGRQDQTPRLADLRGSGSIEQDADVVVLLHREDVAHRGQKNYAPTNVLKIVVGKNRNGPTGVCELLVEDATFTLKNL